MPESLGHYNLLERIADGALGTIYRARDTRLGRTVALRVVPDSIACDPEERARLLGDARAVSGLSHPNLVSLFDIGEEGRTIYLVFEYAAGDPLRRILAGRALNVRRALDLGIQLADALADAHAAGIVHGDLKPDNVVVTPKGHAKIRDIGLARWTAEQRLGGAADARTDIFSLGTILFEMLTGRSPFAGPDAGTTTSDVARAALPPPSGVNPDVPPELDAIVLRALDKSIETRYQSAAAVAAELRSAATILDIRSGESEPASIVPAIRPPSRAPAAWLRIILLLAVAGAAALFGREWLERAWAYLRPPPAAVLAVVPFDAAGDRAYLADALAEDVVTRLGQVAGMTVLDRSSTRSSHRPAPGDGARRIGAEAVFGASVRLQGGELLVGAWIVDARSARRFWTREYRRPLRDVLSLQVSIADDVARALRLPVAASASRVRTASRQVEGQAYDLYARAQERFAGGDLEGAVQLYEQATARDASLAEAHAAMAEAAWLQILQAGGQPAPGVLARVRQAAAQAASIDPDLPQALLAQALAAGTLADALRGLRRAAEADPSLASAYYYIGYHTAALDRAWAQQFFRRAFEIDPHLEANRLARFTGATWFGASPRGEDDAPAAPEAGSAAAVLQVRALMTESRVEDAFAAARAAARTYEGHCETAAMLAGLLADRRAAREAHALAEPLLAAADQRDAPPNAVGCAALAAAALGDPAQAGARLRQLAAQQDALRLWLLDGGSTSGAGALRLRLYPWSKIAGRSAMVDAAGELDAATARLRVIAARELHGILQ